MHNTQKQYNQWELEFIKCGNSSEKLRNYINKYISISDNPFVSEAKELLSKNNNATSSKKSYEIKYLKDNISVGLMACGCFLAFIVISGFISSFVVDIWNGLFKFNTTENSKVKVNMPTVQQSLPSSSTEYHSEASPNSSYNTVPNPQPLPYSPPYYNNINPTQLSQSDTDNNRWQEMYCSQYAEMVRQAERDYNSLTSLGSRYTNNGNLEGTTGRDDPYIVSLIPSFHQLQHRMSDLRYEASKQGVNISQSHWESVDVHI